MKYDSTALKSKDVTFRQAVLQGLAEDGGLFMPQIIPRLDDGFFKNLPEKSLPEIAFPVFRNFIDDIPDQALKKIIDASLDLRVELVPLEDGLSVLELFHGPTLAFKDFGARFLAQTIAYYVGSSQKKVLILVATSGDTGSAVAKGFQGITGVEVGLLYPAGKVSDIQEKQLTTVGHNVHAFKVDGTFDDCQKLVKTAFLDSDIRNRFFLSSANSINIARLLPQSIYYFYAYAKKKKTANDLVFSVPSGNFGNLTAGLFAQKMGLPVKRFIAAVNSNAVFPAFLESGEVQKRVAVQTLSNAMDVAKPGNLDRIIALYDQDLRAIKANICSWSISDEETIESIKEIYHRFGYIMDPHGAVGYDAVKRFREEYSGPFDFIILETAHASKFAGIVEKVLGINLEVPGRLAEALSGVSKFRQISSEYDDFKSQLFDIN